jgi:protein involved in polysaccharide export with SLBB domain
MKPKLILCLALVLSGGLFGCSSVTKQSQTIKVSVMGDVKAPGEYVLPPRSTVVKGLKAARGFKFPAEVYHIIVFRIVNGQENYFEIEMESRQEKDAVIPIYYDVGGKTNSNLELIDGDKIDMRMEIPD